MGFGGAPLPRAAARRAAAGPPARGLAGKRSGGGCALAVAVMSYDGGMGFGLLGDLDAMADLVVIANGIEDSLAELVALARGEAPPKPKAARKRPVRKPTPAAEPAPRPLHFPAKPKPGGPGAALRESARRGSRNGSSRKKK